MSKAGTQSTTYDPLLCDIDEVWVHLGSGELGAPTMKARGDELYDSDPSETEAMND